MIKLTDLLKEEETFTATSKKTGQTSVFKSKDSRDAAVKSGTHSKVDDKEDDKPKKEKPNMFSKDYDAPDSPKEEPKSSTPKLDKDDDGGMSSDTSRSVEDYLNKELGLDGSSDINSNGAIEYNIPGSTDTLQIGEDEIDGKPFSVRLANEDGMDPDNTYKSFDSQKDAMAYAKELGQKLKGGAGDEPKSSTPNLDNAYDADDFQDSVDNLKGKISDEDYEEIKDNLEGLKNLQYDLEDIDRDEDNEEWGMQQDIIDAEVDDLKGLIKQAISKSEPKKDEPTKDSTKERAGNPKINKAVNGKAKELGITPQKLGKEEYESRMSKAAVEALTDANFHSEARKLISILEDKPEWDSNPMNDPDKPKDVFSKEYDEWRKNTVFSSELYDSAEGTDEIAHLATNQSGWEGETSVDAIAFDLKMNGSKKLAAKIQSIFEGKVSNGFKNHSLKKLM